MNTLYCINLSSDDFTRPCRFVTLNNGRTSWYVMADCPRTAILELARTMEHPCHEMTKREVNGVFVSVYSIELDWEKGKPSVIRPAGQGIMVGTGVSGYIKNFR